MTEHELRTSISQMRNAFTSADVGPRNFLTVVSPGDEFAFGSVAPLLIGRMVMDRSGLFLPAEVARPVQPLDRVRVFVTPEDLFGARLSVEGIAERLRQVPLEDVVAWAAGIIGALGQPGADDREVADRFIELYFTDQLKVRARNILRDPSRVLLIPQALMVLIKLAFAICKPREDFSDVPVGPMVIALLNISAYLGAETESIEDQELIIGADPGDLACYFIANQMFNSGVDVKTAWATFQRCWRELPVERIGEARVVDMQQKYGQVTGVALDDLVTVCAVLWTRAVAGSPTVELGYFGSLGWEPKRLEAVLELISATPRQMRQMLADDLDMNGGMEWSTKAFEQFPVVRWNDRLTVLDPGLVVRRGTGMWPLYDILRQLESDGNASECGRVHGCVDYLFEEFARESLAAITGSGRVYDELAIKRAYKKGKVADGAVDYGHAWVVFDVTTTGFKQPTASGTSTESVARDLDNVVRKARQIEATINNLRDDESQLTGTTRFDGSLQFFPVLIVATRFASSPITMTILNERLAEAMVLQAEDVAPLEVMELDDLLAVEATVERRSIGMLTLLQEKRSHSMAMMSMRDFLRERLGHNAPHPERVEKRWRAWFDTAIDQLRPGAA